MTNKLILTLSSLSRWKAFVRKYRGFTSNKEDEKDFINEIFDYQKNWIKDGLGTPLAKVQFIDMWEAIETFQITVDQLNSLDNVDDFKLYYEACLALEYSK